MPAKLSPTAHPPVPADLASMWLAPAQSAKLGPAMTNFVRGVRLLEEDEKPAAALPLVSDAALATTPLADYARYYTGLALTKLERYSEADKVLGDLAARQIDGHLPEDAAFLQAEVREAQKDYKGAVAIYESLVTRKLARPQTAWLRLGLAADRAGRPARSVEALQRAYYDYPATTEADQAGFELDRQDVDVDAALAPKELARAETLFQARRWTHARASYQKVRPFVADADRERVAIRLAGAEIALGRHREGRDALRPMLGGPLADEANFHYVAAARGLNLKDEHRALARAFVEKFPNSPFAEEVLNNLASAFIVDDQDDEADEVFREIARRAIRRDVSRSARPGRPDGPRIGTAASPTRCSTSIRAPRSFRDRTIARRGSTGRAAPRRRPAISKRASRDCGWRRPIITIRITAGSRWRA